MERKHIDDTDMKLWNTVTNILENIYYLEELTYDLAISPVDNVSENLSFETWMGFW